MSEKTPFVSDEFLRNLAKDSPIRQRGELSAEDTAALAVCLPDICGELLARRAAMRPKSQGVAA